MNATITLREYLEKSKRFVIPTYQRGYVWGKRKKGGGKDAVTYILEDSLIPGFKQQSDIFIQGITVCEESDRIILIDGQQRTTFFYLLLNYLQYSGSVRMEYAIRERSDMFLSEYNTRQYIAESVRNNGAAEFDCKDEEFQDVYFFKKTLHIINKELKDCDSGEFLEYILDHVRFLYIDIPMSKAEKVFSMMNGNKAEMNLKPLVIQTAVRSTTNILTADEVARRWEEMETWFWKNRKGDNDTADAGFTEFLRWISIIEQTVGLAQHRDNIQKEQRDKVQKILKGEGSLDFPYEDIAADTIFRYFEALKWISDRRELNFGDDYLSPKVNRDVNGLNAIGQKDCFVLLPVLRYVFDCQNNGDDGCEEMQRNVRRIYEFFKNLIRVGNVSKAVNALVCEAIRCASSLQGGDIVSLLEKENVSSKILTAEEKRKLEILKQSLDRCETETALCVGGANSAIRLDEFCGQLKHENDTTR